MIKLRLFFIIIAGILLSGTVNTASAVSITGQGTWETTLQPRDLDGNSSTVEAYYDTALGITWLAQTNTTPMNWANAQIYVTGLNIGGTTGWRLPTMVDTGTVGCNWANSGTDCGPNVDISTSEMAHMFFVTLGNVSYRSPSSGTGPQPGWADPSNTGPFSNLVTFYYWSSSNIVNPSLNCFDDVNRRLGLCAWYFDFKYGEQAEYSQTYSSLSWAVHSGDIGVATTVPLPPAAWLFGSGLLAFIRIVKRDNLPRLKNIRK